MFRLPAYQELSKEQDQITNLPTSGTHLVVGPPGTGKTVIAVYRAEMYRRAGMDSRFLVYNNTLNQYLETATRERSLADQTATFHSWFWSWYMDTFHMKPPQVEKFVYDWDRIFADIGRYGFFKKYPHLIIDEGQDFPPNFYLVMNLLVKNLTVFADENQRLTDQNSTVDQIKRMLSLKKVHRLAKNYRNTREIAELASQFYAGLDSGVAELPSRTGRKPILRLGVSFDDQLKQIVNYAKANSTKQIGVFLLQSKYQYAVYYKLSKMTSIPVQLYVSTDKDHKHIDFRKNGIMVLNYMSAKGLEFDAVFLPELQLNRSDANPDNERMKYFVLVSRARDDLFLMTRERNKPYMMAHVPDRYFDCR